MVLNFSESEARVYEYLKKNKEASIDQLLALDQQQDKIRRAIETLKYNGLIEELATATTFYELGNEGKDALENCFLEERLCDYLATREITVSELNTKDIPNLKREDIPLAFGLAKKLGLIEISESNLIKVNSDYKDKLNRQRQMLEAVAEGGNLQQTQLEDFLKRKGFLIKKEKQSKKYKLLEIASYQVAEGKELYLTPDMLKSQDYLKLDFKAFDVEKLPAPKDIGRVHPLRHLCRKIREAYLEMGFKEMKGPYVETSFWNMDAMFISQMHPARDIQDTFYLKKSGELPKDRDLIFRVSETHKNGWITGSCGYQYDWDEELAKKLVLRTHTTAATFRTFYELCEEEKEGAKYFCIDKVFRNETSDYTHLSEFHQAEGFIIGDELSLSDLMAFIKEFLKKFGLTKVRFKPTYNPYTEPSVEASGYNEKTKSWIELINAGIFRPEALAPFRIKKTVIAWGFGVERLAMLVYQHPIKDIHGNDASLDWLRSYTIPKIEAEK